MSEAEQHEIEVTEAIRIAKQYVEKTFAEDNITNLGLEEVKWDEMDHEWKITIGFSRPWEKPRAYPAQELAHWRGDVLETKRTYKLVRVSGDGKVLDVTIRTV